MSLKKEKLQEDLKNILTPENKDTSQKSVIYTYRRFIKQHEVDNRVELADDAIIDIISKQAAERIHLLRFVRLTVGMIWLKKQNLKYKF